MRNWHKYALGVLVVLAIGGGVLFAADWLRPAVDTQTTALRPDDADLVASGQEVYRNACQSCHGADLRGQSNWQQRKADGRMPAPPHDVTGHTWHHPDTVLFLLTKYGPAAMVKDDTYPTDMPGFSDVLSDREIVAVLSYIKSTWPSEIRARHDRINARTTGG